MCSAIYPGSFDPPTNGHLDVIRRASNIFDRIIVSVVENPSKQSTFSLEERMRIMQEAIEEMQLKATIEVDAFNGLLVEYMQQNNCRVIIRGLRAVMDFEVEVQQAMMNHSLDPNIETIFMTTSIDYSFVSSSLVKEVYKLGGDISKYVPASVLSHMQKKFR